MPEIRAASTPVVQKAAKLLDALRQISIFT
jgi:hypothetical protein